MKRRIEKNIKILNHTDMNKIERERKRERLIRKYAFRIEKRYERKIMFVFEFR
jgi:hypothetical protein